jgi:hypothetical protein
MQKRKQIILLMIFAISVLLPLFLDLLLFHCEILPIIGIGIFFTGLILAGVIGLVRYFIREWNEQ